MLGDEAVVQFIIAMMSPVTLVDSSTSPAFEARNVRLLVLIIVFPTLGLPSYAWIQLRRIPMSGRLRDRKVRKAVSSDHQRVSVIRQHRCWGTVQFSSVAC